MLPREEIQRFTSAARNAELERLCKVLPSAIGVGGGRLESSYGIALDQIMCGDLQKNRGEANL